MAEHLAERGATVLRFDYPSAGDSPGDDGEPISAEAWLGSIEAAISRLRLEARVQSITLIGLRFGGLLAAACGERVGGVDGLVLLAPVTSGRAYARELSMRVELGQHA